MRKFDWLAQVFLVFDYFTSFLHYIWVHFVDDVFERAISSRKDLVHHGELLDLPLIKHVLATGLFQSELLGLIFDAVGERDGQDFRLGLWLEEVVSILLFFGEMGRNLLYILKTIELV